jgi:hypothetical protein
VSHDIRLSSGDTVSVRHAMAERSRWTGRVALFIREYFQFCFSHIWSARNVSQLATCPDLKPVMNQRVRCAEVPWVKASGTT